MAGISVQQAHAKTKANQALLVCAYEDEAKCRMLNLDGSISFASLQSRAASLPKTQEIIFYWAWPGEASAVGQAAKYREQGFTNVKVLKGGVEAWKAAGYSMAWYSQPMLRRATKAPERKAWVHQWKVGEDFRPSLTRSGWSLPPGNQFPTPFDMIFERAKTGEWWGLPIQGPWK
jgi:rhodanese-related sulfurtransferase